MLSTDKIKQEKQAAVLSVYDFNSKADEDIDKKVTTAFSVLREAVKRFKKHELLLDTWKHDFEKILRLKVTDSDFDLLLRQRFSNRS